MDYCRRTSPSSNLSNALNALLLEYYKALAHVCALGVKLAGKLEHALALPDQVQRVSLEPLGMLYRDIIANMAPLREDTIYESAEEETANEYCARVERVSSQLIGFHQRIIQRGTTLLHNTAATTKPLLTRKNSPCIIVTDTENKTYSHRRPSHTSYGRDSSTLDCIIQPVDITKTHVPSDKDLDSIINFLSSTHLPAKAPVRAQRSSPLPDISSIEELISSDRLSTLIRRHSDVQLYKHNQSAQQSKDIGSASMPCSWTKDSAELKRFQHTPTSREDNSALSASHYVVHKEHQSWPHKDSIWSMQDSSSSEESRCATDQLFNTNMPDLSGIVIRTRRSSHDSTSSQTFEFSAAPTTGTPLMQPSYEDKEWTAAWRADSDEQKLARDQNVYQPLADIIWQPIGSAKGSSSSIDLLAPFPLDSVPVQGPVMSHLHLDSAQWLSSSSQ